MYWNHEQTKGVDIRGLQIGTVKPNYIILSKEDDGRYAIYGVADRLQDMEEHLVETLNEARKKMNMESKYVKIS